MYVIAQVICIMQRIEIRDRLTVSMNSLDLSSTNACTDMNGLQPILYPQMVVITVAKLTTLRSLFRWLDGYISCPQRKPTRSVGIQWRD